MNMEADRNIMLRRMPWRGVEGASPEVLLNREWLATNGLGGYASNTVAGVPTRSYHGLLVAALPAPLGRTLLMAGISEQVRLPGGQTVRLGGAEYSGGRLEIDGSAHLLEFCLDAGLPVWRYEIEGAVIEKRLWMPHRLNSVILRYRLLQSDAPIRLKLMPTIHFRSFDATVNTPLPGPFRSHLVSVRVELVCTYT